MTLLIKNPLTKPLVIASDHAGLELKSHLIQWFKTHDSVLLDLGTHTTDSVDYPDLASIVAHHILDSKASMGILICGTGIGMSIAANRHKGIRAAVCLDGAASARLARAHNNANILCLGARLMSEAQAIEALETFINTSFDGGRHQRRIEKCDQLT